MSEIPESLQTRPKGVVDIVFLMDTLRDMQPCIDPLKGNFRGCIEALDGGTLNQGLVKEWRAKVVGCQNFAWSAADEQQIWSPFTDNATVLENQLDSLEANGRLFGRQYGGEGPWCIPLLESIYHCATMGQTEKDKPLSPDKWRPRNTGARAVVIFTGHEYHTTMEVPYEGCTHDDVCNACHSNRIILQGFAPEMECYDWLCEIDKADWYLFEYDEADPEGPTKALEKFTSQKGYLKEALENMILGLRQACAPETYD